MRLVHYTVCSCFACLSLYSTVDGGFPIVLRHRLPPSILEQRHCVLVHLHNNASTAYTSEGREVNGRKMMDARWRQHYFKKKKEYRYVREMLMALFCGFGLRVRVGKQG